MRIALGDSITNGGVSGVPSWTTFYAPTEDAENGDQAADLIKDLMTDYQSPEAGDKYGIMIGTNDHRKYKSAKKEFYRDFLRACLVWVGYDKEFARTSANITYTGAWGNTGGNNIGKFSRQANATATCSVSGDTVFIGHIIQNNSAAHGEAEIRVDGNLVGTINCFGAMNTVNGASYSSACKAFTGLGAGSHTVEVKTIHTNNDYFYLDYIAGSDNTIGVNVFLSNVIRMSAGGYSTYGSSDAVVDEYNVIMDDLIAELPDMSITLIDNHAAIDPTTDLIGDGVHPNIGGMEKIYNGFSGAGL